MKRHPAIRIIWYAMNALLLASFAASLYGIGLEFSTRSYLKGFSDAIIPSSDNAEQKTEAILAWIAQGPARRTNTNTADLSLRDPANTLNYQQLLNVCGTATNAFVNLAQSAGLSARRLLLLDKNRMSKHVVVEVRIDGRWVIVDPVYHTLYHFPDGRLVTLADMKNPETFRSLTSAIPGYPPSYSYESTAHLRLSRIPGIGRRLRQVLTFVWPSWEESINWTLLVERESFAFLCASIFLFCFFLAARLIFSWYCAKRLGIPHIRLRDRIARVGQVLAGSPQ
ncbi:MAG: transglutaminase domain-containing protein [Candidatus Acidiferrales bacterium]